jgi:hypothetical protein
MNNLIIGLIEQQAEDMLVDPTFDAFNDSGNDRPAESSTNPDRPAVERQRGAHGAEARSVEHEARGLINAIGLLSRCLDRGAGTEMERVSWFRQIPEAEARLEKLYAAGLSRRFLFRQ